MAWGTARDTHWYTSAEMGSLGEAILPKGERLVDILAPREGFLLSSDCSKTAVDGFAQDFADAIVRLQGRAALDVEPGEPDFSQDKFRLMIPIALGTGEAVDASVEARGNHWVLLVLDYAKKAFVGGHPYWSHPSSVQYFDSMGKSLSEDQEQAIKGLLTTIHAECFTQRVGGHDMLLPLSYFESCGDIRPNFKSVAQRIQRRDDGSSCGPFVIEAERALAGHPEWDVDSDGFIRHMQDAARRIYEVRTEHAGLLTPVAVATSEVTFPSSPQGSADSLASMGLTSPVTPTETRRRGDSTNSIDSGFHIETPPTRHRRSGSAPAAEPSAPTKPRADSSPALVTPTQPRMKPRSVPQTAPAKMRSGSVDGSLNIAERLVFSPFSPLEEMRKVSEEDLIPVVFSPRWWETTDKDYTSFQKPEDYRILTSVLFNWLRAKPGVVDERLIEKKIRINKVRVGSETENIEILLHGDIRPISIPKAEYDRLAKQAADHLKRGFGSDLARRDRWEIVLEDGAVPDRFSLAKKEYEQLCQSSKCPSAEGEEPSDSVREGHVYDLYSHLFNKRLIKTSPAAGELDQLFSKDEGFVSLYRDFDLRRISAAITETERTLTTEQNASPYKEMKELMDKIDRIMNSDEAESEKKTKLSRLLNNERYKSLVAEAKKSIVGFERASRLGSETLAWLLLISRDKDVPLDTYVTRVAVLLLPDSAATDSISAGESSYEKTLPQKLKAAFVPSSVKLQFLQELKAIKERESKTYGQRVREMFLSQFPEGSPSREVYSIVFNLLEALYDYHANNFNEDGKSLKASVNPARAQQFNNAMTVIARLFFPGEDGTFHSFFGDLGTLSLAELKNLAAGTAAPVNGLNFGELGAILSLSLLEQLRCLRTILSNDREILGGVGRLETAIDTAVKALDGLSPEVKPRFDDKRNVLDSKAPLSLASDNKVAPVVLVDDKEEKKFLVKIEQYETGESAPWWRRIFVRRDKARGNQVQRLKTACQAASDVETRGANRLDQIKAKRGYLETLRTISDELKNAGRSELKKLVEAELQRFSKIICRLQTENQEVLFGILSLTTMDGAEKILDGLPNNGEELKTLLWLDDLNPLISAVETYLLKKMNGKVPEKITDLRSRDQLVHRLLWADGLPVDDHIKKLRQLEQMCLYVDSVFSDSSEKTICGLTVFLNGVTDLSLLTPMVSYAKSFVTKKSWSDLTPDQQNFLAALDSHCQNQATNKALGAARQELYVALVSRYRGVETKSLDIAAIATQFETAENQSLMRSWLAVDGKKTEWQDYYRTKAETIFATMAKPGASSVSKEVRKGNLSYFLNKGSFFKVAGNSYPFDIKTIEASPIGGIKDGVLYQLLTWVNQCLPLSLEEYQTVINWMSKINIKVVADSDFSKQVDTFSDSYKKFLIDGSKQDALGQLLTAGRVIVFQNDRVFAAEKNGFADRLLRELAVQRKYTVAQVLVDKNHGSPGFREQFDKTMKGNAAATRLIRRLQKAMGQGDGVVDINDTDYAEAKGADELTKGNLRAHIELVLTTMSQCFDKGKIGYEKRSLPLAGEIDFIQRVINEALLEIDIKTAIDQAAKEASKRFRLLCFEYGDNRLLDPKRLVFDEEQKQLLHSSYAYIRAFGTDVQKQEMEDRLLFARDLYLHEGYEKGSDSRFEFCPHIYQVLDTLGEAENYIPSVKDLSAARRAADDERFKQSCLEGIGRQTIEEQQRIELIRVRDQFAHQMQLAVAELKKSDDSLAFTQEGTGYFIQCRDSLVDSMGLELTEEMKKTVLRHCSNDASMSEKIIAVIQMSAAVLIALKKPRSEHALALGYIQQTLTERAPALKELGINVEYWRERLSEMQEQYLAYRREGAACGVDAYDRLVKLKHAESHLKNLDAAIFEAQSVFATTPDSTIVRAEQKAQWDALAEDRRKSKILLEKMKKFLPVENLSAIDFAQLNFDGIECPFKFVLTEEEKAELTRVVGSISTHTGVSWLNYAARFDMVERSSFTAETLAGYVSQGSQVKTEDLEPVRVGLYGCKVQLMLGAWAVDPSSSLEGISDEAVVTAAKAEPADFETGIQTALENAVKKTETLLSESPSKALTEHCKKLKDIVASYVSDETKNTGLTGRLDTVIQEIPKKMLEMIFKTYTEDHIAPSAVLVEAEKIQDKQGNIGWAYGEYLKQKGKEEEAKKVLKNLIRVFTASVEFEGLSGEEKAALRGLCDIARNLISDKEAPVEAVPVAAEAPIPVKYDLTTAPPPVFAETHSEETRVVGEGGGFPVAFGSDLKKDSSRTSRTRVKPRVARIDDGAGAALFPPEPLQSDGHEKLKKTLCGQVILGLTEAISRYAYYNLHKHSGEYKGKEKEGVVQHLMSKIVTRFFSSEARFDGDNAIFSSIGASTPASHFSVKTNENSSVTISPYTGITKPVTIREQADYMANALRGAGLGAFDSDEETVSPRSEREGEQVKSEFLPSIEWFNFRFIFDDKNKLTHIWFELTEKAPKSDAGLEAARKVLQDTREVFKKHASGKAKGIKGPGCEAILDGALTATMSEAEKVQKADDLKRAEEALRLSGF